MLGRLKQVIYQAMLLTARVRLEKKINEKGWRGGIGFTWIEVLGQSQSSQSAIQTPQQNTSI